ncbi:MAG: plastocyanin/azurin family copper-binding protein [Thermoplasmata archaeon]|nr:plastocyanin/azurin family copper-binding protein [Thermoplasmata archaeon]
MENTRPLHRGLRRAAGTCGVLGLLLLAIGLPLAAPIAEATQRGAALSLEYARPAAAPASVGYWLNLTDAPAFVPARLVGAEAGALVTVHLNNTGSLNHSFTLVRSANVVLNRSWDPEQLQHFFSTNGSLANVSAAPGRSASVSFTLPTTLGASYEFTSLVPYQFQAGMLGFLNVSAGAGTPLTEQTTDQLKFLPDALVVNATSYPITIDVQITNGGSFAHTWTLVAQANVFPTPQNYSNYFGKHAPLANAAINSPGQVVWANFSIPAQGEYEYLCTTSGHFAAGMNGTLFVGVQPPALSPPLSTALVQVDVLAGAGLLLGVGVVLATATNFMGRFPPKTAGHH